MKTKAISAWSYFKLTYVDCVHLGATYQNSGCWSYEVTPKVGCRRCGRSGVTGLAGAYYVGARMQPQLIGCALAQEPGVLNFRLRVANNGGRRICGDKKVIGLCFSQLQTERSNYKNHWAYIRMGDGLLWSWVQR